MPPAARMPWAPAASKGSIRCSRTNCGAGQERLSLPESVAKACAALSLMPGASVSKSRPRSIMRAHSGWVTTSLGRTSP
jgi:hypothetical protein